MERPLIKSFEDLSRDMSGGRNYISGDMIVDQMNDLRKALSTAGGGGFGDATPLRLENLDSVMTAVLYQASHLKIFNALPRVPSAQIFYQWIRELTYGTQRGSIGFKEGGVAQTGISSWVRGNATIKYLGVKRGFTHQIMQVGLMGGAFVDPVMREHRNGTLQLLGSLERFSVFGDSAITDAQGNPVHYDGILKQVTTQSPKSVFDKNGQPLDFEDLENYSERLVRVGKLVNFDSLRMFTKPRVLSDLAKLKLESERKMLTSQPNTGYRPGVPLKGYDSQQGYVPFEQSIFLDPVEDGRVAIDQNGAAIAEGSAPPAAPGTPTGVITSPGTPTNMTAGTVYYHVSAVSDGGESLTTPSAAQVITAGQQVALTIPAVSGATAYRIYRGTSSDPTDDSVGWIATIAPTGSVGGAGAFTDTNQFQPNTGIMLMMNMDEPDIAMAQLAPLIKFPLAMTSTTIEFMLMLYHVLAVKAAERMIIVKNIGFRA